MEQTIYIVTRSDWDGLAYSGVDEVLIFGTEEYAKDYIARHKCEESLYQLFEKRIKVNVEIDNEY